MENNGEEPRKMKDCFGVCFGWFMQDLIGDTKQLEQCYNCPDYDKCFQMAMVRSLTQLRYELRRGAMAVSRNLGGTSNTYPNS
jgi:hypothetical protein